MKTECYYVLSGHIKYIAFRNGLQIQIVLFKNSECYRKTYTYFTVQLKSHF